MVRGWSAVPPSTRGHVTAPLAPGCLLPDRRGGFVWGQRALYFWPDSFMYDARFHCFCACAGRAFCLGQVLGVQSGKGALPCSVFSLPVCSGGATFSSKGGRPPVGSISSARSVLEDRLTVNFTNFNGQSKNAFIWFIYIFMLLAWQLDTHF